MIIGSLVDLTGSSKPRCDVPSSTRLTSLSSGTTIRYSLSDLSVLIILDVLPLPHGRSVITIFLGQKLVYSEGIGFLLGTAKN